MLLKLNVYLYWFLILFIFSVFLFISSLYFMYNGIFLMLEWNIMLINSLSINYLMIFDWVSISFSSVVMLISSMVVFYSSDYMGFGYYNSNRFLFLVILFVFSMILMIISPNLISILLGWDGLGLVSYCLVIYYNSMKSYLAGMITCLTNRIGDIGLLISACWIMSYGGWHFMYYLDYYNEYIFYLMTISCFTKSAQIPFSCWLPAAMAAPTPVSSLVHSSTLVTAGVYLLIRFYNSFNFNNYMFLFISLVTMTFSSICAIYEFDLKKIIALSTLSQLGLMMSSLFLGLLDLSFFHLLSHAMFKSLLFLCSGIFIFYMNDNQDIRLMGSVCMLMPFTTSCFNIANLTLCGIPFLSGFYSKDMIIEYMVSNQLNYLVFVIFYFSLGLTAFYSFRLFYYSMIHNNKFISMNFIYDEYLYMKLSIFILTLFSIFTGCMMLWLMNFDFYFILLPMKLSMASLLLVLMGIWLGMESCKFNYYFNMSYYLFNGNMWFMSSYLNFLYKNVYLFSENSKSNSLMWSEYYGPMGISYYLLNLSNFIQFYSMNNLKVFLLTFLIWFMILI
ncbi:NADH dehydrogenase subunit 5 (mitochondrion) [Homalodisca vitripennis]|uniref:NADH-ubiquinone oxidoreductase chain 5 n=1 Tax=Homalodisca vitripennis TaxID=197043 RepID=Q5FYG4_HOMVI|nr:NADH dehydrogenase subunit 5 [Homalodisca vitripennis]AAW69412.1 NADH dehydrogenase subunit 5 [Homalodisca vitripennis]